jgi:benzylsuccinate CoA-transferase BbsF subunit
MLVAKSDVLVESFAPGVMERLNLSVDTLRAWNPSLIVASHSLQGQSGPRSHQRGYGQLSSAITGWFNLTGETDERPVGPYSAYTDFIAWPVLFSSILLALEERDRTGIPSVIDHSHMESSAYFAAPEVLAAQAGTSPHRNGNRESYACPSDTFLCLDSKWCALTVVRDEEWQALCGVLGAHELSADPRFSTFALRKQHEDELTDELGRWFLGMDADSICGRLLEAGVAAGRVYEAQDLFQDDQLKSRHAFRRLPHPVMGEHAVVAPAFSISGLASGPSIGFPLFGQHTEQICLDVLGLSSEQIAAYAANGVFE